MFIKHPGDLLKNVLIGEFFEDAKSGKLPGYCIVETKWNLPALTRRDANANNMLDMLDFSRPAFGKPPALAKPLVDTETKALACDTSGPGTIPPPGSVTKP